MPGCSVLQLLGLPDWLRACLIPGASAAPGDAAHLLLHRRKCCRLPVAAVKQTQWMGKVASSHQAFKPRNLVKLLDKAQSAAGQHI